MITMNDRPACHCGATDCCEGATYPECQTIGDTTHYSDEQHPASPHTFTD